MPDGAPANSHARATESKLLPRLKRSLAHHGPGGTTALALKKAIGPLRRGFRSLRERSFDRQYGTDTRGLVWHGEPGVLQDARHYQGSSPRLFREIVSQLPVAPQRLTLIDVGCGKGRVLVLADELGFRRIVGVEVSDELARTARDNLRTRRIGGEVQVIDAAQMHIPDEALLVYLYNPFGEPTLQVVLERLRCSVRAQPRLVFVVYVNPRHGHVFLDTDDFVTVAARRGWVAVQAKDPGTGAINAA
jgi:SAM-dependent methyltransferase